MLIQVNIATAISPKLLRQMYNEFEENNGHKLQVKSWYNAI